MAELTFKSAGVSTREIDLSGPTAVKPQGVPAGVIGTSQKGPAFVPITVATYQDFVAEFGGTDGKKFGPLAMNEWMKNARSGTFVRVLGVGDAKKRGTDGEVQHAGFVVGNRLPQNVDDPSGPGIIGDNPYAGDTGGAVVDFGGESQIPGRTYFLGALMREAYGDDDAAAASATFTVDPDTLDLAALGALGVRGEALRFADAAGKTLTLWFHEGEDDTSSAGTGPSGDLADFEDDKNLLISIGSRSSATVTMDSAPTAGRIIQFTDMSGDKLTIDFVDGGGAPGDGDVAAAGGSPNFTATIDIQGRTTVQLAVALHDAVTAAHAVGAPGAGFQMTSADADPTDNDIVVTLTAVGQPGDEVDGGAVISGEIIVTGASTANQVLDGGSKHEDATAFAAAIASKVQGASIDADLTFSSALGVVTVTNDNGGADGNEAGGNGIITNALVNDVQAIQIAGVASGVVTVGDTTATTADITFVDAAVAAAGEVVARAHANATRTITLGAVSTLVDGDTMLITDSTTVDTLTIVVGDSGDPAEDYDLVGSTVTINTTNAGFHTTSAQDHLVAAINKGGSGDGGIITATATGPGDDVLITHDVLPAGADGNGATVSASVFADASITNPDGAFEGGVTETTILQIADDLAAAINASAADVLAESDGVDTITVTQMQAGVPNTATLADGGALGLATIAAASPAGADGTDFASPGPFGAPQAGISDTVSSFTGGEASTENATPEHDAWSSAGIDTSTAGPLGGAWPIIRAVMHTPAGVRPALVGAPADANADTRANQAANDIVEQLAFTNAAGAGPAGARLGSVVVDGAQERFTLLLNGHTPTPEYPAVLTASMDPQAPDYFMNVLNHDAACIEKAGHYIHAHYNVYQSYATVDAEGIGPTVAAAPDGRNMLEAAFLLRGVSDTQADARAMDTDANLPDIVDYESHEDRFRTAKSPWVISQVFGGKPKNLFRLHALDDGVAGSGKFKVSVEGVMMDSAGGYGTFDLLVRSISDDDVNVVAYEKFMGLDLNPSSERYVARVIGDQHMWYDFDKREGSQKLVVDGIHPNRSKYIRVEMDPEVDAGTVAAEALPMGYRGYYHLWTDAAASAAEALAAHDVNAVSTLLENVAFTSIPLDAGGVSPLCRAKTPPVPMRRHIAQGTGAKRRPDASLYWGTMFQVDDDKDEPNKNLKFNSSILSYGKYFPMYHSSSMNPWLGDNAGADDLYNSVVDSDRYNNNIFSLERIQVVTRSPLTPSKKNPSVKGKVDGKQWAVAEYRRDGVLRTGIATLEGLNILEEDGTPHSDIRSGGDETATVGTRFLDPKTDLSDPGIRRFAKFSFFLQGGFDGTNIYRKEKHQLRNEAANWEMEDQSNQGGTSGCTISSYRKAIDVMAEKADVDIKLLAIPGLRHEAVTDYAIDAVESRFDAMYIMDVEERSVDNKLMLDYSIQKPGVNLTVENFSSRNIDSSFAAAYFPDVVIKDPATQTNVQCPPSVAVLGAFALNDSLAHPWFAPAGFSRGALKSVVETQVKLSRANLDTLYESDVNPLAAFPHTPGVVVWGQKTLQQAKSALDRVNVRRLLIEIRREVRKVGNNLLFEPNRAETLARFSSSVNPILQRIQAQQGLDKFKVIIDTTTTTQADIENNTVRGKIFLQPTRTVEFISLDFVVTNAGMEV